MRTPFHPQFLFELSFCEPLFLLLSWLALSLQLSHVQPRALAHQRRNRNAETLRSRYQPLRVLFRNANRNHLRSDLVRGFVRLTWHTTGTKCIYAFYTWINRIL